MPKPGSVSHHDNISLYKVESGLLHIKCECAHEHVDCSKMVCLKIYFMIQTRTNGLIGTCEVNHLVFHLA